MASERARLASRFLSARADVYQKQAASLKAVVDAGNADEATKWQYAATDGLAIRARRASETFGADSGSLVEDYLAGRVLRHVVAVEINDALIARDSEREGHETVAREGIAIVERFSGRHAARLAERLGVSLPISIAS